MTKTEIAAIENVIARLKEPRCGGTGPMWERDEKLPKDFEGVSRIYLNSWIIPALELLLPGEARDTELARRLAGK